MNALALSVPPDSFSSLRLTGPGFVLTGAGLFFAQHCNRTYSVALCVVRGGVVTDLADKKCKPCEGGVQPLAAAEARAQLTELHAGWTLNDALTSIERDFSFPAFSRTIAFVNAVAFVATNEGHHPQMIVNYGSCRINYTTTAISGLSDNDFICAAKIDRLAAEL